MSAQVTSPLITFRDRMRDVWSPPWLATGNAERYLYAFGLVADIMGDALIASVAMRFPGVYGYESLPFIGRERRISRGPQETDASYAGRLRRWLHDHRRRGGPYALLAQLYAYLAPNTFPIQLIYRSGRMFTMAPDGTVTRTIDSGFAPDTNRAQWARWWLFYSVPEGTLTGFDEAAEAEYRHVPREWNAAHCLGHVVVMEPGAELWSWPLGRTWNESGTWNTTAAVETIEVG